jgi:hypothetical protein
MARHISLIITGLLILITGYSIGYSVGQQSMFQENPTVIQPYCPQEDSCRAEYSHGHWTIKETPH